MIELYQFYFSHYCEKVRWALDYKGIPYKPRNLLPGLHAKPALRLAATSDLPILVDGKLAVQDSTEIINYLDKTYPEYPLTPLNSDQAKEALDWEEYLDEEIGVTLRLWFYYHVLPDRTCAQRFMLQGAPWYGRPLMGLMFPRLRSRMRELMNINAETARECGTRLSAALDRVDETLPNRRYLVGERFSRADLTACALLSPYCMAADAQVVDFPHQLRAQRDQHENRRFFQWVREIYAEHRHSSKVRARKAA